LNAGVPPPLHGATALVGQDFLIIEDSRSHSDITVGKSPLGKRSVRHRSIPDNKQSQETDSHAPGGIRTHNPSKRRAAEGVGVW